MKFNQTRSAIHAALTLLRYRLSRRRFRRDERKVIHLVLGHANATGSNAVVVSGCRTANGYPILANDPHLPFSLPVTVTFHQYHLVRQDPVNSFEVTGINVPGLPGVISGHNQHVAWGITNSQVDVQDLVLCDTRRTQPRFCLFEAESLEEEIRVRGAQSRRICNDFSPLLTTLWNPCYRARRMFDWVAAKQGLTVDDLARLQQDALDLHAQDLLPRQRHGSGVSVALNAGYPNVTDGAVWSMVAGFSATHSSSRSLLLPGQSGDFLSRYYADQFHRSSCAAAHLITSRELASRVQATPTPFAGPSKKCCADSALSHGPWPWTVIVRFRRIINDDNG